MAIGQGKKVIGTQEFERELYDHLLNNTDGLTAYEMAHKTGKSVCTCRKALNQLVKMYPSHVWFTEDIHNSMVRKTYKAAR